MTAALPSGLDLEQVDAAARPQDDLFGHVNGRWLAEHVMPADRSSDGAFHALRDLSEERVREIVEEAADDVARTVDETGSLPVPTTDHARIGTLYRMFMDTEAIEAAGLSGLAGLLDEIGATRDLEGLVRRMAAPDSGASAVLAYV
ncbi:MAG TPA: peptidase M13, partial [Brachybacterium paraconglomeratum]|nr:peptidase M13 [Brachybacterium paraconglomeratum]